jgi:hypothetical protein
MSSRFKHKTKFWTSKIQYNDYTVLSLGCLILPLQCTETCQKYPVTVIFYYIFHIKPQFLKVQYFLFFFYISCYLNGYWGGNKRKIIITTYLIFSCLNVNKLSPSLDSISCTETCNKYSVTNKIITENYICSRFWHSVGKNFMFWKIVVILYLFLTFKILFYV